MADEDRDDLYLVVVNDEEQYSIWETTRPTPDGWTQVGDPDQRESCLSRIEELWTDMRPRSAR